jgi:hypothetical protein
MPKKYKINGTKFLVKDACDRALRALNKTGLSIADFYNEHRDKFHEKKYGINKLYYIKRRLEENKIEVFDHIKIVWECATGVSVDRLINNRELTNPIAQLRKAAFLKGETASSLAKQLGILNEQAGMLLYQEKMFVCIANLLGIDEYSVFK